MRKNERKENGSNRHLFTELNILLDLNMFVSHSVLVNRKYFLIYFYIIRFRKRFKRQKEIDASSDFKRLLSQHEI